MTRRVMIRTSTVVGMVLVGLAVLAGVDVVWLGPPANPVLRTIRVGADPTGVVVDARTERAFIVNYTPDNSVSVLDTRSGRLLRTVAVGHGPYPATIEEHSGLVFVPNSYENVALDGSISVLDARTGAVVRTIPVPGSPYGVTVDRVTGRLFVAENDHGVVVVRTLDVHTGASLHTVTVDGPVPLVAMDELTDRIFIPSPGSGTPSATPAGVYTHSGHVLIVDARTGILLGTVPVSRGPTMVAVDTRTNRAFVGNSASVSVLDATSGQLLRTDRLGRASFPPDLAVDERTGHVFVAAGGHVYLLEARGGRMVRILGVQGSALAIDQQRDHVLVTNPSTNGVSVLDARTGAVLHKAGVGWQPGRVAVDEQSGHIVVINNGGSARVPDAWAWVPSWLRQRLPFLPPPGSHTRIISSSVTVLDVPR